MSTLTEDILRFAAELRAESTEQSAKLGSRLATALQWTKGGARTEQLPALGLPVEVTRTLVDDQPAAIFVGDRHSGSHDLLRAAALFAYHASIEWGVVTNSDEAIIFNSHWIRDGFWYHFPPIRWSEPQDHAELFAAITPSGLMRGDTEQIASRFYEPDSLLLPVDEALVDRLDHWRDETLRHVKFSGNVDEKIQLLFAQLFVLRAVEDRILAPEVPTLWDVLDVHGETNLRKLKKLFESAQDNIDSELFDAFGFENIPTFVLGGIIRDLYIPSQLPIKDARYNFAWIDADILGRAYEKYLSTLLIPSASMTPQLDLWQQPLREVERVTIRKASGVYYTPSFLVRYLTERCLDYYFEQTGGRLSKLPMIADISCGSGSFLTAAVDSLVRRFRAIDSDRNWGRELIDRKCILGIDSDPRAATLARLSLWLRLAEEPKPLPLPRLSEIVINGDSLKKETWRNLPKAYDIILGNPPFIATGNVQSRKELSAHFQTARGRFDYSYLFVELALEKLKPNGVLGLVIPNRLFRNKDAGVIREMLTSSADLLTVADFASIEVFRGTKSYIGTVIARKDRSSPPADSIRFIRVSKLPPRFAGVRLSQASPKGAEINDQFLCAFDAQHPRGSNPWLFLSPTARNTRIRLEELSEPLSSMANIFQGIKVGANDIYIVEIQSYGSGTLAHIRNGLGDTHLIEEAILRPVVFGADIRRYDLVRPKRFLIYPYRSNSVISETELQDEFPRAFKYLSTYRDLLSARQSITSAGQKWYELIRKRDEAWLNSKKLLIRDLATETSFALDDVGNVHLVGGTAVVPAEPQLLYPLLGYMNSNLVNWYLNPMTPSFKGDFQKFEPQHLENVPVLNQVVKEGDVRDALSELVNSLIKAKQAGDVGQQEESELEIDHLLCETAGISASEMR